MKKETSNQFTEGLVSDLNPIITPNNVLVDNLNGTIITYDGNEYTLQNDRGNYELKHCRLNPNYIPVGIKEYGDILYIVSYNPLDKNVEIGSYPSPLMISEVRDKNIVNNVESILKNGGGKYTKLTKDIDDIIFNGDNFKLNPGDEYCLQQEVTSINKYETHDFYIMDENAQLHNINDKILLDQLNTDPDWKHVPWIIPGWVVVKPRLAELSTAGINVKHFYYPKGGDKAFFSFNLRLNVDDTYLINSGILQEWLTAIDNSTDIDLGFIVQINVDGKTVVNTKFKLTDNSVINNVVLGKTGYSDWYEDAAILWKNISGKITISESSTVTVSTTPFISDGNKYTIEYDNLRQELVFDLKDVDNKPWTIGNSLYQFFSEDDIQMVYTNIDGPLISSFPIKLLYTAYDLNGNVVVECKEETDYMGVGENVFGIKYSDKFQKENIYILKYDFVSDDPNLTAETFPSITRILITSDVFDDFRDRPLYDRDVAFNEWFDYYWNKIENKFDVKHELLSPDANKSNIVNDRIEDKFITDSDKRYLQGEQYNTFFNHINSGLSEEQTLYKGYLKNYLVNCNWQQELPKDGLWKHVNLKNEFAYYDYHNEEWDSIDDPNSFHALLYDLVKIKIGYNKLNMPFEFVQNLTYYNLSDNLSNLTNNTAHNWRIEDKPAIITLDVCGRKTDNEDKKSIQIDFSWNDISGTERIDRYTDNEGSTYNIFLNGKLLEVFEKSNAPFILVKVIYRLTGKSANFEIAQTLYGASAGQAGFEFHQEEDGSRELYFVAFNGGDIPVLIPLSEEYGLEYFSNMCRGLKIVTNAEKLSITDRYLLQIINKTPQSPQLHIIQKSKIESANYFGIDLLNVEQKQNATKDCIYNNILILDTDKVAINTEVVLFDETFPASLDINSYPYVATVDRSDIVEGITEIEGNLNKLSSKSEMDFLGWEDSVFFKEYKERISIFGSVTGVYSNRVNYNDLLIKRLTSSYQKSGKLTLNAAEFNKDLTSSLNRIWIDGNGEIKEEGNWNGKYAVWVVFHNWWKMLWSIDDGASSKDWYVSLGGCWKENPSINLLQNWSWLADDL